MSIQLKDVLAVDGGLGYLLHRYPQAAGHEKSSKSRFKIRPEKSASASLKRLPDGTWIVTDFGGDSKGRHAVDVAMMEDGLTFVEALNVVAKFYNLEAGHFTKTGPAPTYSKRPAAPDDIEQDVRVSFAEHTEMALRTIFTDSAWAALSPDPAKRLTRAVELCARYHLKALAWYETVSKGTVHRFEANDTFPIFYFDEGDWGKLYKPLAEKKYRFQYRGKKPQHFIHGLEQARAFVKERKVSKEALAKINELNSRLSDNLISQEEYEAQIAVIKKDEKEAKLPAIIRCSGGSDALNVAAQDYWVVWQNSETEAFRDQDYKAISALCEEFYNLPDIDDTGREVGHKLAMEFLEMRTIWLPERMLERRDREGKPTAKDLRDYLRFPTEEDPKRVHGKYHFDQLVKTALPYQFWDYEPRMKDGEPVIKYGRIQYEYRPNLLRIYNFLYRNGFARYRPNPKQMDEIFIRQTAGQVEQVQAGTMKDFINGFLEKRNYSEDLRNVFYAPQRMPDAVFQNLPLVTLDFTAHDAQTQYLFFEHAAWRIRAGGIEEVKPQDVRKSVWKEKVIRVETDDEGRKMAHKVKLDEPYFRVWDDDAGLLDIEILRPDVPFLNFLVQTCRVHWRKELEERLDCFNPATFRSEAERQEYIEKHDLHRQTRPTTDAALLAHLGVATDGGKPVSVTIADAMDFYALAAHQDAYREAYRFAIDGPLLTADEAREQKAHLINRLYCIGYALHRHKFPSRPWGVWAMDLKLSVDGESHGGSGKTIVTNGLKHLLRYVPLPGRSDTIGQNDFIFEKVSAHTDLVLVDDVGQFMNFKVFYEPLTSDWVINRKGKEAVTLRYGESPKIWFNCNFGDRHTEGSDTRRKIVTGFSDYYHDNPHGEYREKREPIHDFGKQLFYDWNADEWGSFYNLMAQAVQHYLVQPAKIDAPKGDLNARNLLADMGDNFLAWADVYFCGDESNNRLNRMVVKDDAMKDFVASTNLGKITAQRFMKALKSWARYRGFELNPDDLKNSQGRIVRGHNGSTAEMVYMRTPGAVLKDVKSTDDVAR